MALLLILAVVLGIEFRQLIAKQLYEASVRRVLKKVSATQRGAYLADVRFRQVSATNVVVAVYRTSSPFPPQGVGSLECSLPLPPGKTKLELRIRPVPVTVTSKQRYLDSTENSTGDGRSER